MAFRTQLPKTLKTPEEVNALLLELYKNNEFWHLDDNPNSIVWGTADPTKEEKKHLTKLWRKAWDVCKDVKDDKGNNWGIWALPAVEQILAEIRESDNDD